MNDNFFMYLEASKYFSFFPIKDICKFLKLQLIEEGHTITICSDIFVIDINMSNLSVNVLFVDENLNNLTEYLNNYFNNCIKKRDFLLFYVFLRYFLKCENPERKFEDEHLFQANCQYIYKSFENIQNKLEYISKKIQTEETDNQNNKTGKQEINLDKSLIFHKIDPIILENNVCGNSLLYKNRLIFCSCIFYGNEQILPLTADLNRNIFTHCKIKQNIQIKNDFFEIKNSSVYINNIRSAPMSYLWKKGFSVEEIFECFDIDDYHK